MYRAVYNFLRMFKKDSGAHFTYNLGVAMIRTSLLFILWAVFIICEFYFLSSPKFIYKETVNGKILSAYPDGDAMAADIQVFLGDDSYTFTEYVTAGTLRNYYTDPLRIEAYRVYELVGRGIDSGRNYGTYMSTSMAKIAEWQYYWATPGARPPVQTWGIWVSILLAVIAFMIGKRQIRLSMKYPRSDVPKIVSGAPAQVRKEDPYWEMACKAAREDMRRAMTKRLAAKQPGEADADNETAVP